MAEVRLIDANALTDKMDIMISNALLADTAIHYALIRELIAEQPTFKPEVWHGRWIECDYKHMEHGMIETEPNAGLCCSECRAAFQKKKMTYKAFCPACGARMDGGADNG